MDPARAVLERAGLSEYEAKAYLGLLSLGSGTAEEVARVAGIPRTRIYDVLAGMGPRWVSAEAGRPKRYRPNDPRLALEAARREMDELVGSALPSMEALFGGREQRFAGSLWLLEGLDAFVARTLVMVGQARKTVTILVPGAFPLDSALLGALRSARLRGVEVLVVGDERHRGACASASLPFRPAPPGVFQVAVAVDERQGAIGVVAPSSGGMVLKGLWNPNPEMASFLKVVLDAIPGGASPNPRRQ